MMRFKRQNAFTLVEVMTSVVIIAILVAVLLPAVGQVRKFARKVRQKAQLTAISTGVELFKNDFGQYPDSSQFDKDDDEYNGCQKLAEALLGQDLLGVHPSVAKKFDYLGQNDVYETDGNFKADQQLYTPDTGSNGYNAGWQEAEENRRCRKGPYLEADRAEAADLRDIRANKTNGKSYDIGSLADPGSGNMYVLTDSYKKKNSGYKYSLQNQYTLQGINATAPSKIGMPILYFKADTKNIFQKDTSQTNGGQNVDRIYNWHDNQDIFEMDIAEWWDKAVDDEVHFDDYLGKDGSGHDVYNMQLLADKITNHEVSVPSGSGYRFMPHNARGFILVSAGEDGFYGTEDDVFNFEKEK